MANLSYDSSSSSTPHPSDFPSDQAELLRDLAFHGYGDAGSNGPGPEHANGEASSSLVEYMASLNAYATAGHSNGFENMEDSIALLESLANFDQGSSNVDHLTPPVSNDHFASLLQAAATAGGQEAARQDSNQRPKSPKDDASTFFKRTFPPPTQTTGKRKRAEAQPSRTLGFLLPTKRQKTLEREATERELENERDIWGPDDIGDEDDDEDEDESTAPRYERPASATADARALGVHSAAALFRRPSAASKKYTRPPMSKLFTSLHIGPEQFLHLQAAAKAYMLDEKYPERSECVGSKSKGDTDMVKLNLFGCVEAFLEDEGWGERCFGPNSVGAKERKLKWPQMKNKIISLVTPLLRRMVTNERQRQYAISTRKSKRKSPAKIPSENPQSNGQPTRSCSPSPYSDIDPKLNQYHYNPDARFSTDATQAQASSQNSVEPEGLPSSTDKEASITYQINILKDNRRIKPKVTLTPATCPGFPSFVQHIYNLLDDGKLIPNTIKALGPDGQVDVEDEESWVELVDLVKGQEWMDGQVKIIVELDDDES
ncbi:uncharacterized protein BP5553_00518 [Venustampulla echinocandica]|uniref:Uncharacterized protein n=1 Tax=Venustampulla echinocandica TaxID=2656787 RepID=A0A370TYD3_9HELO|nr:uncharacterized protein BP5553_00518 [Venustampulla echinocandica]RDL40539.1 hypothetical protein BP5553_00518 [Venustampulla echinocandica]